MGILYGLAAALLWGGGDLFINRLTTLIGTARSLLYIQILSLLCWVSVAIFWFPSGAPAYAWGIAALCGVFHVLGLVMTYRAFEVGTLSLVSPIASSFAIVTVILALASGERPAVVALLGVLVVILGIIVVTRSGASSEAASLKGIPEALLSALGFGVMFWQIDRATDVLGMAWPLVVLKIMACSYAVGAVMATRPAPAASPPRFQVFGLALAVALSDTLAWGAFILGTHTAYTSIVTAIASLFSVFTVVLAAIFLKERLTKQQLGGIVAVFVGILLVSLHSSK